MGPNLQEYAARFANNNLAKLNNMVANTAGVDVMWFRAHPKSESTDVIFQTYTLHNVDQCPINVKALYTDTQYDDAALTFSTMGIEYKPSLTLEIPVLTWTNAVNNDGTIPQEKDIVFIPLSKKLWQVSSSTPVASMAGQVTSYKMLLETYRPEADRFVSGDLKTAIEENTTNIDELFGKAIEDTIADLVDDKQTSHFSSTSEDKYKRLGGQTVRGAFTRTSKTETIYEEVNISGHLAARTVYDMRVDSAYAVEYLNIYDEILSTDDTRCLSVLVKKQYVDYKKLNVVSIEDTKRNRRYGIIDVTIEEKSKDKLSVGDKVTIKRNTIIVFGEVIGISGTKVSVQCPIEAIRRYDSVTGWMGMPGFVIYVDEPVNLLSAETENGDIDISIYSGKYVVADMCGRTDIVYLTTEVVSNMWYGFIINIQKGMNVNMFTLSPSIERVQSTTQQIGWGENVVTSYFIKPSKSYITNIRLYNVANDDIDKQLEDMVSYMIKDNSKAIINDSADLYMGNKYYGEQR